MHGFTLRLPEDYRVHGPDIVALSFFATASDQNDGGAVPRADLYEAVLGSGPPPDNRHLMPFWKHARSSHPRLFRMRDILDYEYAVILLSEDEFQGALCPPPDMGKNRYFKESQRPEWMTMGGGAAFFSDSGSELVPIKEQHYFKFLGGLPEKTLDWHRAIRWSARKKDPNAGLPPEEVFDEPSDLGYQSFSYYLDGEISAETYREHDWAKPHKADHIGGTMRPSQAVPDFSPFYIEFEEYFGGYNFGGGNAQVDFYSMKFDWACG